MHRNRPFDRRQPFPRFRALQAGLPRSVVDSPAFRRLLHGVIVDADVPDSALLRVKAALACFFDDAHASHASAARVWGVPVRTRPGEHVTVPEDGVATAYGSPTSDAWRATLPDGRAPSPAGRRIMSVPASTRRRSRGCGC